MNLPKCQLFAALLFAASPAAAQTAAAPDVEILAVSQCSPGHQAAAEIAIPGESGQCLGSLILAGSADVISGRQDHFKFVATLSVTGRKKLFAYTLAHVNSFIAVRMDGHLVGPILVSTPIVSSTIELPIGRG